MKKTDSDTIETNRDEMNPEYTFDYSKSKSNRFAGQSDKTRTVVVLDPDLSTIFSTANAVNKVLRALVKTMPTQPIDAQSRQKVRKVA